MLGIPVIDPAGGPTEEATMETLEWDWEDPDGLNPTMDQFLVDLARCEKLEPVLATAPYDRDTLRGLGLTGIEFAAWRSFHPGGLATDLVPLRSATAVSERGRLCQVDGDRYFVELDISEPLPLASQSVEWAYAEHLIEHVPPRTALAWLAEVRRVLVPGGVLRLTTPDLRRYVEGYLDGGQFFGRHRRLLRKAGLGPPMPERPAFMFNQLFYLYGHRWIYDLEELTYVLSQAGFDPASVRKCDFRQGLRADIADLDRALRRGESMYVEVTA